MIRAWTQRFNLGGMRVQARTIGRMTESFLLKILNGHALSKAEEKKQQRKENGDQQV